MKPIWVIKVGGAIFEKPQMAHNLLVAIGQLQLSHSIVLVHGGGAMVDELLQSLNFSCERKNGLRVTPDAQIPYVVGALAGTANKQLCAQAIASGLVPVGLSLMDGDMSHCVSMGHEFGAVGTAAPQNSDLLLNLLQQNFLPVVSSIGADAQGQLLNINADQAASTIASLLGADLLLLSDVEGVLDVDKKLIEQLSPQALQQLIQENVIADGMEVKVNAALTAANSINRPVTIAGWHQPEQLLSLAQGQSIGSTILPAEYL